MNHMGALMGAILAEHDPGSQYAIVQCMECSETYRIEHSAQLSNGELTFLFEQQGWAILPTRCPKHAHPESGGSES